MPRAGWNSTLLLFFSLSSIPNRQKPLHKKQKRRSQLRVGVRTKPIPISYSCVLSLPIRSITLAHNTSPTSYFFLSLLAFIQFDFPSPFFLWRVAEYRHLFGQNSIYSPPFRKPPQRHTSAFFLSSQKHSQDTKTKDERQIQIVDLSVL